MNHENWALITGASSGIGLALSFRFAKEGWHLVLVARDAVRLSDLSQKLEKDFQVKTVVMPMDLTCANAAQELFEQLSGKGIRINALINNAGSGACGSFIDTPSDKDMQTIDLNIRAVTLLTKSVITHMHGNGGKILNVASTGSYQPGPFIAVYYASKAYVLSLTQALRKELKGSGIVVSALCPGSTATEFSRRAGKKDIKNSMTPEKVADCAYKGLMKGKAVIIPGLKNKMFILASKLLPAGWSASIVGHVQRNLVKYFKA